MSSANHSRRSSGATPCPIDNSRPNIHPKKPESARTFTEEAGRGPEHSPAEARHRLGEAVHARRHRRRFHREQAGAHCVWHSPYTNADAKAAKKAFNLPSVDAAKELIGRAVITRNEGALEAKGISRARYDNHDCTVAFQRSPYSEADAKQALKQMPFLKNLTEAKEYIGLKVVNKTEDILQEVGVTRSEFDSHDMLAAFNRSGYTAKDVDQAKKKFDF